MDGGRVTLSTEAQGEVLSAFSKALQREVHNLSPHPNILWQQLHNRLQWEGNPVTEMVAKERKKHSAYESRTWLQSRTPYRESLALVRTLIGHTNSVLGCAVSPDGRWIVSASADKTLKLWDIVKGREIRTLTGHNDCVNACAISPDGSFIVSASSDKTLKIWDPATGKECATIRCENTVQDCSISPDGKTIVSANSGSVNIWCVGTWDKVMSLHGLKNKRINHACMFSRDGKFVVAGGYDADAPSWKPILALKTWDFNTGKEHSSYIVYEFPREPPAGFPDLLEDLAVVDCAMSPDCSRIVCLNSAGRVQAWDVQTGKNLVSTSSHMNRQTSGGFAFSPDGSFIALASIDSRLEIRDAFTFKEKAALIGHGDAITDCDISKDGSFILSASKDMTLKIWDIDIAKNSSTSNNSEHKCPVTGCDISSDASSVISISRDNKFIIWDVEACSRKTIQEPGDWFPSAREFGYQYPEAGCKWSPDDSFVVSSFHNVKGVHSLRVWDALTLEPRALLKGHEEFLENCAIAPDGSFIVSARVLRRDMIYSLDKPIRVWDSANGDCLHVLRGHTDWIECCAISMDGHWIVSASRDKTLKVWDSKTGEDKLTLRGHTDTVTSCVISPNCCLIVSASMDNNLKVWKVSTGQELMTLNGHKACVRECAISPDGSFIVSASSDKTLKVWDTETGQERLTLSGHTDDVSHCAISPDAHFIASVSDDKTLKIWNAVTGIEVITHPILGLACCLSLGRTHPLVVAGDKGGNVYILEIILKYGPIIITAIDRNYKLGMHCPFCKQYHPISKNQLGSEMTCPTPNCGLRLKLNPFTIEMK